MKYRILNQEELKELEKEFVDFLASNTITADDWTRLKASDPVKVESLIAIFSDIVLDKALQNIKYVEYREAKNLLVFNYKKEDVELIGISVGGESPINFNNPETFTSALQEEDFVKKHNLEAFTTSKKYQKQRELEVFELLQSGGLICDEKYYNILMQLVVE